MRLWSLHPDYLDTQGLVALWREGLLAQKVLMDKTKGYKNHPQLERFKGEKNPVAAISFYLKEVYKAAEKRGYQFNKNKLAMNRSVYPRVSVSKGQLIFEMQHLCEKLKRRDYDKYQKVRRIKAIKVHPLFKAVKGDKACWEKGETNL